MLVRSLPRSGNLTISNGWLASGEAETAQALIYQILLLTTSLEHVWKIKFGVQFSSISTMTAIRTAELRSLLPAFKEISTENQAMRLFFALAISFLLSTVLRADEPIRALIIDGQNNHAAWPKTTMMMKRYLEDTKRYKVDIARTKYTWQGDQLLEEYPLNDGVQREALKQAKPDPDFKPEFSKYQVVISNFGFGAAKWPDETNVAFEKFVADGGGLVVVHAADNCFGDWQQYNEMIGLGGWGNRDEKSGPYIYLDESGTKIVDNSPGKGGSHGSQHEFTIIVRDEEHPITKGLPLQWLHAKDELYDRLRGPGSNMKILATAYADKNQGGSGRHEPMVMAIDYGKGRVFHTTLGHADYSMECVGFITLLVRGTDWAATGKVIDTRIPADFPTAEKSSQRKFD